MLSNRPFTARAYTPSNPVSRCRPSTVSSVAAPQQAHPGASQATKDPLLLRVARGESGERTPVWLMRQAGRYMAAFRKFSDKYTFRERSENADIATELSLQPWHAFHPDGVIMFSDILTLLPAIGVEFQVIKGRGPLIAAPLRDASAVAALRPLEDPAASLPFVGETLRNLRAEVGDGAAVLGFAPTPWTLAAYCVEGRADRNCRATKTMMLRDPALLACLMDRLADAIAAHLEYQVASGAQVLQLFDSWAHHLTPAQHAAHGAAQTERVLRRLAASCPGVPVMLHTNGCAGKLAALGALPAAAVGVDWHQPMRDARVALGADVVVQGNVDPMLLFGSEADVRAGVAACLEEAGPERHIMNLGHGVIEGTPEASVGAFVQLTKELSAARRRG
uniref:Uroporphyrinogen decarboxylase n=2 Tax=Auxenochlorella protothecoides TaxID=3075 RepID=A0A1D2AE80_AUXPR